MGDAATLTDARDIRPGKPYPAAAVAGLFDVTPETVSRWVKAGRLTPLPRPNDRAPLRFLGSEVLALLGMQGPPPAADLETRAERERRAKAGMQRINRLAKGRP